MAVFLPNPDLDAQLMEGPDAVDGMLALVEEAADLARAFAPTDEGDYRDSIKAVAAEDAVYLMATDYKAFWIEYGSVNNPTSAPLRRGLLGAGFQLEESPPEG